MSRLSWPEAAYSYFLQRKRGRYAPREEGLPLVSVGNITLGGTGKTPFVSWLAQRATREGLDPAIVARGYGGTLSARGAVVSDGEQVLATAREAGDEPLLHALSHPGVPVVIGRDRHAAVRRARGLGARFAILDDAFQFWSLRRQCDIVLLDARRPLGNGRLLPLGRLREGPDSLRRAHALVLTRCDHAGADQVARARRELARWSDAPVWASRHAPRALVGLDGESEGLGLLEGAPVAALSAIAHNGEFARSLEGAGAQVRAHVQKRDHHFWTRREVASAVVLARSSGARMLVATEKDAVKIDASWLSGFPLRALRVEMEIDDADGLWELVRVALGLEA
jgi:tetraacyldisaccharide 4'-kinase